MGRYSEDYSLKQMRRMGFLKLKEVPKKYRTKKSVFWFAYYGLPFVKWAEVHARVKRNVGSPVTLKTFSHKSREKARKLFDKALGLEY